MTIDEPGRDRSSAKVDHLGGAADPGFDLIGGAHRRDLPGGDGHGLRDRVAPVDREDAPVDQHHVGRPLSMRTTPRRDEHQRADGGDQRHSTDEPQPHDFTSLAEHREGRDRSGLQLQPAT